MDSRVVLIGGPTVLIEVGGVRLLTDPTFDPAGSSYPLGPVRLEKVAGPALAAEALGHVDAVLLSHDQHPDNLDGAGREFLRTVPMVLTTPAAAARLGGTAVGLSSGDRCVVRGAGGSVTVTGVSAQHGPPRLSSVLGPVTGFLVQPAGARESIYVSGDTVAVDDVPAVPVGLAVLHGGAARLPAFGEAGLSFTAADLVAVAGRLGDCPVMVVHQEGWDHFGEEPAAVAAAFTRAGIADRLVPLTPGGTAAVRLS
ncbi:L-ascorbate metabolism protein UlaG, beta-lactamase superfamily [Micromonospora echinaurantiaca]|uniref:L-ascorbate metabolism protein UlaG, beta-lactamase superfamily n=1 Tax=Micromonospora echinaurantiaca TaxID=47857 RepID=A0A1C5KBM7_9ACTN|nr:MBL fold metallo-hydrolase [Micromonospora echinaurantiaca]SCG80154.1 L-ascorbate metabolism protein UlaG, beta-lactamase superfamily [Micromonospora echinaurantiaca]